MNVHDFLKAKAQFFTAGDMAKCAAMFELPATIKMGERALHAPDAAAIQTAFETYRANMLIESYALTEAEVLFVSEPANGCVNAIVTWRNTSSLGALISEMEANYILRDDPASGWRIVRVEYLDAGTARLMQGVALT
ncbi:hypothetical protein [Gymnodinialimonas ulvae]|uniref:hypothetical protein n=1 Tax=Gymnodinialimonas ulvae TaxID=3126504 RepID=UPI0030A62185